MIKILFTAAFALVLSACSTPTSTVVSGSARPNLKLVGAPNGSALILDGNSMGPANQFDGVNGVLAIEEGPHTVEVRNGNGTLIRQRIFAASGETVSVDVLTPGNAK